MRASIGVAAVAASGVALGAFARDAQAESSEPITLAYDAPRECPDANAFFREISARTTRVRAARTNEDARVLRVAITSEGGAFVARLSMQDAATSSRAREVRGATCGEVVEALGLIAALSVDPKASIAPTRTEAPGGAPTASAQVADASDGSPSASSSETAPPETVRKPTASSPPSSSNAVVSRAAIDGDVSHTHYAAGVQVEGAAIADVVMAGRLFGEIELGDWPGAVFVPSIRLAVVRTLDVERRPPIGRATMNWTQVAMDACPLRFPIVATGALDFRPCIAASAGVLSASSTQVDGARSRSRPWMAMSAAGRLSWVVVPSVALDAEAGVVVPLTREDFFFEPAVHIFQAPLLALLGRIGVRMRFP